MSGGHLRLLYRKVRRPHQSLLCHKGPAHHYLREKGREGENPARFLRRPSEHRTAAILGGLGMSCAFLVIGRAREVPVSIDDQARVWIGAILTACEAVDQAAPADAVF